MDQHLDAFSQSHEPEKNGNEVASKLWQDCFSGGKPSEQDLLNKVKTRTDEASKTHEAADPFLITDFKFTDNAARSGRSPQQVDFIHVSSSLLENLMQKRESQIRI